jgi:predicted DNA-binding helix-hairpin-helix protein
MDLHTKLAILADAAKYDASCASSGTTKRNSRRRRGIVSTIETEICHSYTPGAVSGNPCRHWEL